MDIPDEIDRNPTTVEDGFPFNTYARSIV